MALHFKSLLFNLREGKSLEPSLDRFILMKEFPYQLGGVVLKHQ